MSGQAKTTKGVFLPAPIDGVNYIANPKALLPTEARELINYKVYDDGIKERAKEYRLHTYIAETMVSVGAKIIIVGFEASAPTTEQVYEMASYSATTCSNITGAITLTEASCQTCYFNKRQWFFNGIDTPFYYDAISGGNVAAVTYTGPTLSDLAGGFPYRSRLYMWEKRGISTPGTKIWYSGVGAVSGALTSIDFAEVFQTPGEIVAATSWSLNPGNANDEQFVIANTAGEVLIYSGDYPAASNWTLVNRVQLPVIYAINPAKIGQEVLFVTSQGLIPLSSVVATRTASVPYFSTSKKLGTKIFSTISVDTKEPFLYGFSSAEAYSPSVGYKIYAQNYERGAWSTLTVRSSVYCLEVNSGYLLFSGADGTFILDDANGGEDTAETQTKCKWFTPFLDLGSGLEKRSLEVRVIGADETELDSLVTRAGIKTDFKDNGTLTSTDSRTTDTGGLSTVNTVAPAGQGRHLSYCFEKTPNGEINKLYAVELIFEEGGRY